MNIIYLNCGKYEVDRKKIITVIDTTFAVVKRKPGKKNDQLPDGFLAQLVRALHRYRRGHRVRIPSKPDFFFRLSFHNCKCKSCVYNCDDILSI